MNKALPLSTVNRKYFVMEITRKHLIKHLFNMKFPGNDEFLIKLKL
jgi:hypothetical protein